MASSSNFSVTHSTYVNLLLNVIGDTVGVVLFIQVLYRALWMSFTFHGALPPVVPVATGTDSDGRTNSTSQNTQIPPNYSNIDSSDGGGTYLSRLSRIGHIASDCQGTANVQQSCLLQCTSGEDTPPSKLYDSVVPFLSIWLMGLQAALGAAVYIYRLAHKTNPDQDCQKIGQVSLGAQAAGFYTLLFAMGMQSHIVNSRCRNIFIILAVGGTAHFVLAGMTLAQPNLIARRVSGICDFTLGHGDDNVSWLQRLPLYLGISDLLMCFFVGASMVNGSRRLITGKPSNIIFAWLRILAAFQGIGFVLLTALFGVLWWAGTMAATGLGHFDFLPWWTLLWPVMARLFASAIHRRVYVDSTAHLQFGNGHDDLERHLAMSPNPCCRYTGSSTIIPHLLGKSQELLGPMFNIPCHSRGPSNVQESIPPSYNSIKNTDEHQQKQQERPGTPNRPIQFSIENEPIAKELAFANADPLRDSRIMGKGSDQTKSIRDSDSAAISLPVLSHMPVNPCPKSEPTSEPPQPLVQDFANSNAINTINEDADIKRNSSTRNISRITPTSSRPRVLSIAGESMSTSVTDTTALSHKPTPRPSKSPLSVSSKAARNRISLTRDVTFGDQQDSLGPKSPNTAPLPSLPPNFSRQLP